MGVGGDSGGYGDDYNNTGDSGGYGDDDNKGW